MANFQAFPELLIDDKTVFMQECPVSGAGQGGQQVTAQEGCQSPTSAGRRSPREASVSQITSCKVAFSALVKWRLLFLAFAEHVSGLYRGSLVPDSCKVSPGGWLQNC